MLALPPPPPLPGWFVLSPIGNPGSAPCSKALFAINDNDVILLSSSANSHIGDNATHSWQHADDVKNVCRYRQVGMGPNTTIHYYLVVMNA